MVSKDELEAMLKGSDGAPESTEAELGKLLRQVVYADLNSVCDRAFEKIEGRVQEVVEGVAGRVVPKNIAALIETIVTNRLAVIEETFSMLSTRVARVESGLAAGVLTSPLAEARRVGGGSVKRAKARLRKR